MYLCELFHSSSRVRASQVLQSVVVVATSRGLWGLPSGFPPCDAGAAFGARGVVLPSGVGEVGSGVFYRNGDLEGVFPVAAALDEFVQRPFLPVPLGFEAFHDEPPPVVFECFHVLSFCVCVCLVCCCKDIITDVIACQAQK